MQGQIIEKDTIRVEYQEEDDYHYTKERLYYISWIRNLGLVAILVAIGHIVISSIHLSLVNFPFTIGLVVAAALFFLGAILTVYWANNAAKTYKGSTELFQPRLSDRLTKTIFIIGLLLAGGAALILVNLYMQQEYSTDYVTAQSSNANAWNSQYEGRTIDELDRFFKISFIVQGCFAGFFFFYFLLASRAAFRCLKWSNQAMSYLVFLGCLLLLVFGLGVVFFAEYAFGYGYYPQIRAHFPVWNVRSLYFLGMAISGLAFVGFLVDHRSWRVGFFVLAFLLLLLLALLVNFTGYAYRHTRQTYEYYKGVDNLDSCRDRMNIVHLKELENYGCPQKYVTLDHSDSNQSVHKWEYTSADHTALEPAPPAQQNDLEATDSDAGAASSEETSSEPSAAQAAAASDASDTSDASDVSDTQSNATAQPTVTTQPAVRAQPAQPAQPTVTTEPARPTTSTQPDGTTKTTYSDGTRTTTQPNGTTVTQAPDNTTTTTQPNGTTTNEKSDGTTTTTQPNSTTTSEQPDGTKVTTQPDGTTSTEKPDGTTTTTQPDGSSNTVAPDGTVTTKESDGTVTTSSPNGTTTTVQPDGTKTVTQPDGTRTTTYPDGSRTTQQRDGTSTSTAADGTTTTTKPNGTKITTYPNGTTSTTQPDGNTTVTTSSFVYSYLIERSLADSDHEAEYALNTKCCGLQGELYTVTLLSLANFSLLATLAGCLVSIGCYYFWYVTWVDSARDKRKDFVWLGLMVAAFLIFLGLQLGLHKAYIQEKLAPNGRHLEMF